LKRAAPGEGLQWFEVDPFVAFHSAAAWEEGDHIHVIICRCGCIRIPIMRGAGNDFRDGSVCVVPFK
jgi:carotenoid cleavage dioxygenase-like enzyme